MFEQHVFGICAWRLLSVRMDPHIYLQKAPTPPTPVSLCLCHLQTLLTVRTRRRLFATPPHTTPSLFLSLNLILEMSARCIFESRPQVCMRNLLHLAPPTLSINPHCCSQRPAARCCSPFIYPWGSPHRFASNSPFSNSLSRAKLFTLSD